MIALPIRVRLTLWYFSFVALAGLLLSLASWFMLRQSLDSLMHHELDERLDDVERFLATCVPGLSRDELRVELRQEYQHKDEGKWLEILDDQGNWLYFSSRYSVADPLTSLSLQPGKLIPFQTPKMHSIRVLSREVHANGRTYSIESAISADRSARLLAAFRVDLWLLVPVVVLSAALIGHVLSRKALRPIAAIVAEARRINDQNLATRVPVVHTQDELAELSETLNQMLARIEVAFRGLRSLTANASHELRTPLSLIRARVEIALCFPRTTEQYRSVLEDVQAETIRMTELVESLLTLARAEAGTGQLELEPLLLATLASHIVQEWAPTAERLSLDITLTGTVAPVWVLGNQESLQRLLRILLDNACRYTPSGGWIRLSLGKEKDLVTLAIEDSGVGIAGIHIPHLFERFYRAQKPLHHEQNGSGIGLSLAKWIAEQHKATITVDSALGLGSCFRIKFPACETAPCNLH